MFRLKCGCHLLTNKVLLIFFSFDLHRESVPFLWKRKFTLCLFLLCVCIFTPAVYVLYISHAQCTWSAVWDFQKLQAGCHEMKVSMCCAGLRNLLQGLTFSAKYCSKHSPPQRVCPYSKIGPKKCNILGCSKSTCTHRTTPPGSILPCRFFSCKVCC